MSPNFYKKDTGCTQMLKLYYIVKADKNAKCYEIRNYEGLH